MNNAFQNILNKLNIFIKKYYTNELIKGLILFFSFGLLYFLFIIFIEYFLWLSPLGRTILFVLFIGLELFFFLRFIGFPLFKLFGLQKGISKDDAAVIIGNHFPDVSDKLLNILQLKQSDSQSELVLASINQKAANLSPIPFQFAINFKSNLKYLKYSILPILILLFIFLFGKQQKFKQSYARVTHYQQAFEREAPFHYTLLSSLTTVANTPKKIQVSIAGDYLPEQVTITYDAQHYFLNRVNDSVFEYTFPPLSKNTTFLFNANAVKSPEYTIQTIATPQVNHLSMHLQYPTYLHKKAQQIENTGSATIPEGTFVTWFVNAKNTDSIQFSFDNIQAYFSKQAPSFKYAKRIKNNLLYTISTSNKALHNYEQLAYQLDVIKDMPPNLLVQQAQDSLDKNTFYYLGKATDDYGLSKLYIVYYDTANPQTVSKKAIAINKAPFSQFVFTFPGDLPLVENTSYQYYFEVFDNDAVNGSKSTKSKVYNYYQKNATQRKEELLQDQKQSIKQLEKTAKALDKNNKSLKNLNNDFKQSKQLDWKSKKRLDNFIKRQEQYDKMLKTKSQEFKKKLEQLNDKKEDVFKKALEERIKELSEEELKKRESLLDELKKLSEKLNKEDLVKKIEELSKKNKQNQRSLEQIVELTKRYYVQEKMNQLADKLEKLAQKQETLAKEDKPDKKAQEALKKEFEKLQKELSDLDKQNKDLKHPINKPDSKKGEEEVKKDMDNAQKDMEQSQQSNAPKSEQAKSSQKSAAKKMKQMSQKMQAASMASSGGSSGEEMNPEDIETLRQILENLVTFSLDQEALMNRFSSINYKHASFAKYLKKQHRLQNYFQFIDDSLFALALRQPKISSRITDKIEDIHYNLKKSLEVLADNQMNQAQVQQQYTVTYANDLAYLLSQMLDAAQNPPPPMMGKGSCSKPGGFSLQDIIKKQGELSKKMQQGMKPKSGKNGKSGKQGTKPKEGGESQEGGKPKEGKDGKQKGGTNPNDSDEMNGEMFKIYQQQQELKNQLKLLLQKNGIQSNQLIKKMDEIEKELLYKGFSNAVLEKMQSLKHELLKLQNASFTQGKEDKRKAITNTKNYNNSAIPDIKTILKYFQQDELLNRKPLPLQQEYKQKVNTYFKNKSHD